jgi:hypothetical protein
MNGFTCGIYVFGAALLMCTWALLLMLVVLDWTFGVRLESGWFLILYFVLLLLALPVAQKIVPKSKQ